MQGQNQCFRNLLYRICLTIPPRWPEVVQTVKKIVEVWAANAHKHERVGEWIERIGWPKFFKLTGIEFKKQHIDDFKHGGLTYKTSVHLTY